MIKVLLSGIASYFPNYQKNKTFKLKKHNIYINKITLPLLLFIAAGFAYINFFAPPKAAVPAVGDSPLTSIIVAKDLNNNISQKIIHTRSDLAKIADRSPLGFAFYRILPGENLSSVASKFGLSMATVLSMNRFLDNAHSIGVGQKILLPTRTGILFSAAKKESIDSIAKSHGIPAEDIIIANALKDREIQEGMTVFLPGANLTHEAMAEILGYQFINPVQRCDFL